MGCVQNILLIDEGETQSTDLEIVLRLAGYKVDVQSSMMCAMNLYGLMRDMDRAYQIVLIVYDGRDNPYIGFFKRGNFPNIIMLAPQKITGSFSYAEEGLISVCHKETLMDVIPHCSEIFNIPSNSLGVCV